MTDAIRDIFNRIPALEELRGAARIEAEEVLDDAVEASAAEGEIEPQPDGRAG